MVLKSLISELTVARVQIHADLTARSGQSMDRIWTDQPSTLQLYTSGIFFLRNSVAYIYLWGSGLGDLRRSVPLYIGVTLDARSVQISSAFSLQIVFKDLWCSLSVFCSFLMLGSCMVYGAELYLVLDYDLMELL